MKDASMSFLDSGSKNIHAAIAKKVKRKKLTKWESECIFENLKSTLEYKDIGNSDLVIEAVPEILDLKHRVSFVYSEARPQIQPRGAYKDGPENMFLHKWTGKNFFWVFRFLNRFLN